MIGGLPADDAAAHFGPVLLDIVTKGGLGGMAANHQHFGNAREGVANLTEELMLSANPAAVLSRVMSVVSNLFSPRLLVIELLNKRVVMVDKHDRVGKDHDLLQSEQIAPCRT